MLPLAAALIVASVLVASAGAAIGLNPASTGYDVVVAPEPNSAALVDAPAQGADSGRSNGLAPLTGTTIALEPVVVASGTCEAVYYSVGQRTANGETFDPTALTAAHRSLPFGTQVRVTNLATGASVVVRINDRAEMRSSRCLDLSVGAFAAIASPSQGVADVRYEVLAPAS